jgi:putative DNA primase/helicase
MDSELKDLLNQNAIEADNDSFTHLTTYDTIKRWIIKPNHQTEFWKEYCDLSYQNKKLCLAERVLKEIPIIVQLKLKFNITSDESKVLYNEDFLHHICHIYQSVVIETLKIDPENQAELVVSVLESESYYYEIDPTTKQKCLAMDIKLHFPFTKVDVGFQKRTIRSRAIKLLNDTNAINKLIEKPIGDWNQIISDDFDSPIMMFGSTENPDQPKLKLSHNWHWISKEMINIEELALEEIFFPSNHKSVQDGIVEEHIFEEIENVEFWLPMIFSLDYWSVISHPKTDDGGRFNMVQESKSIEFANSDKMSWSSSPTEESTIDICEKMMTFLNKERYYEEPSWLDMGRSLNHCTKAHASGLALWLKYTENIVNSNNRPIPKYMTVLGSMKITMSALYRTFAGKPITEKTMGIYARIDSPNDYADWHRDWCASPISKSLNGSHTDIATAASRVYWLDFLYCPITKRWFIFKDGKWTHDIDSLYISNYLSGDFIRRLETLKSTIVSKIKESNDENVIENGNTTILRIDALIMKLKFVPFKNNIITELKTKMLNHKFDKCCDANPNILGLANGVLEVVGGNVHFRAAKPEDYVLMNTKIDYDDTYTWDSPEVVACMAWMAQVFPDPELKLHFLKFAASCIKGRNSDKIFPIFTGEGNNSKSMIVKLFTQTFGEYAIKLDMANFTGRNNNAGNASPHMARAKSVRLALADEAADDVPMHKETIKRIVGGDSFYTRKLHDNGGDIEVFFKLILSCNKVPIIPKADTAIKNRVKIFPFLGTWTSDASKWGEPNTYELKENFEDDIPGMVPAFMWILVQHFPIYSIQKLKDPKIVTEYTENYWKDNDVYAQFAADCIIVSNDKNAKVPFSEMYSKFRIWWKDSFDGVKVPEKPLIKRDLQARFGHLVGKYFLGISLVEDEYGAGQIPTDKKAPVQPPAQPIAIDKITDLASENLQSIKEIVEEITQPKIPNSIIKDFDDKIKYVKDFSDGIKTNKYAHDEMGDIQTKLWSPGIMSAVSGEITVEDDGAVDI